MTMPVTSMAMGIIGRCGISPSMKWKAPSGQRKMSKIVSQALRRISSTRSSSAIAPIITRIFPRRIFDSSWTSMAFVSSSSVM